MAKAGDFFEHAKRSPSQKSEPPRGGLQRLKRYCSATIAQMGALFSKNHVPQHDTPPVKSADPDAYVQACLASSFYVPPAIYCLTETVDEQDVVSPDA
jgi:hypothetical protein